MLPVFFFFIAFAFLPAVLADPVVYNFTLRCDIPDVRYWCAEAFIWEEDIIGKNDPLGYSWLCTRAKEVNFEIPVSPREDEIFGSHYEMNYQVFTTCASRKHKRNDPKKNCRNYMSNGYQNAKINERTVFNHKITFDPWNGQLISDLYYTYPSAFIGISKYYRNVEAILASPCGWSEENEENREVHWQWLGRPKVCSGTSCEGSRYVDFWRKVPYERKFD